VMARGSISEDVVVCAKQLMLLVGLPEGPAATSGATTRHQRTPSYVA
jgi:hypothetical protein